MSERTQLTADDIARSGPDWRIERIDDSQAALYHLGQRIGTITYDAESSYSAPNGLGTEADVPRYVVHGRTVRENGFTTFSSSIAAGGTTWEES